MFIFYEFRPFEKYGIFGHVYFRSVFVLILLSVFFTAVLSVLHVVPESSK
jgi:hypothetical protein